MGLVEVKTAELVGQALDWAVGQTEEFKVGIAKLSGSLWVRIEEQPRYGHHYKPSTDWAQGGPLRDKYDVGIEPGVADGLCYAYVPGRELDGSFGETALIALCRAIVAAKLGDVVQVPAELVWVAA